MIIPATEVDSRGLHVCNLAAMRRALASLETQPEYVLTDGFPVDGLGVPGLPVWKGDRVAACVAPAPIRRRASPASRSGSYSCTDITARQRPPSITGTATIDCHTSSLGH